MYYHLLNHFFVARQLCCLWVRESDGSKAISLSGAEVWTWPEEKLTKLLGRLDFRVWKAQEEEGVEVSYRRSMVGSDWLADFQSLFTEEGCHFLMNGFNITPCDGLRTTNFVRGQWDLCFSRSFSLHPASNQHSIGQQSCSFNFWCFSKLPSMSVSVAGALIHVFITFQLHFGNDFWVS